MASIIVAIDENNGIGYKGELLAHIPEDLKRFKKLTIEGGFVMMGRKTYESLPNKPLSNRKNYVITSHPKDSDNNQVQEINLNEAKYLINISKDTFMENRIFVIGGGSIYKELLPYCKDIYLTKILKSYDNVDTYFPLLDLKEWFRIKEGSGETDSISYEFWHYRRIS